MSINRHAARRDENEPDIVKALKGVYAEVERMRQPCDLLVKFRGRHFAIEVDNPASKYRQRSEKQLKTIARMGIPMVQTADEALRVIGAGQPRPCTEEETSELRLLDKQAQVELAARFLRTSKKGTGHNVITPLSELYTSRKRNRQT